MICGHFRCTQKSGLCEQSTGAATCIISAFSSFRDKVLTDSVESLLRVGRVDYRVDYNTSE